MCQLAVLAVLGRGDRNDGFLLTHDIQFTLSYQNNLTEDEVSAKNKTFLLPSRMLSIQGREAW